VKPDDNRTQWQRAMHEFAHNGLFSLLAGPLINGMSFAINHNRFIDGVKEVAMSLRGWKCNALLAIAVGSIGTGVNWALGRGEFERHDAPASSPSPQAPIPSVAAKPSHASREDARREQAADTAIRR